MIDATGGYCLTNRAYESLTGYTRKELAARNWLDVTHPLDVPLCREQTAALVEATKSQSAADHPAKVEFTKRYITKSGRIVWAKVAMVAAEDDRLIKYTETAVAGDPPAYAVTPMDSIKGWIVDNWRGVLMTLATVVGTLWGQYKLIIQGVEQAQRDAAQARAAVERIEETRRPQATPPRPTRP